MARTSQAAPSPGCSLPQEAIKAENGPSLSRAIAQSPIAQSLSSTHYASPSSVREPDYATGAIVGLTPASEPSSSGPCLQWHPGLAGPLV